MSDPSKSHDLPMLDKDEVHHALRRAVAHDAAHAEDLWENRGIMDTADALERLAKAMNVEVDTATIESALAYFSMGMSFGYELALERLFKSGFLPSLDFDARGEDD